MGTQEQATPQEASRPSALGKFCSKWPSLRLRPQSSGDWYSVKSVGTRTHVQTTEFQIRAWLRGLVLATLRASPECLGVNPRFCFPPAYPATSQTFFRAGGAPRDSLHTFCIFFMLFLGFPFLPFIHSHPNNLERKALLTLVNFFTFGLFFLTQAVGGRDT